MRGVRRLHHRACCGEKLRPARAAVAGARVDVIASMGRVGGEFFAGRGDVGTWRWIECVTKGLLLAAIQKPLIGRPIMGGCVGGRAAGSGDEREMGGSGSA
ncbi:hypothetical protein Acsp04_47280 [Actinomadura sp. NBRC 104425]|nr:hypothetical protein Acsp04_47280 [Actinomadura sp. NBRC 104425]